MIIEEVPTTNWLAATQIMYLPTQNKEEGEKRKWRYNHQ